MLPDKRAAILRGLVPDWPAVRASLDSPQTLVRYLQEHDSGTRVDALMMELEAGGRHNAMSGFNFYRNRLPLSQIARCCATPSFKSHPRWPHKARSCSIAFPRSPQKTDLIYSMTPCCRAFG